MGTGTLNHDQVGGLDTVVLVPLDQIHPENNDRKVFTDLDELAESIRINGLMNPITVRPDPAGGYFLVAGERRYRASRIVDPDAEIKAFIVTDDDEQAAAKMLTENTSRADLNPIEEAEAYQSRIERFGWTIETVAKIAGKTVNHVEWTLQLLDLDPAVQLAVKEGQTNGSDFGTGRASALMGLDHARQRIALRLSPRLNVDALWNLCNRLRAEQNQGGLFDGKAFELVQETYVEDAQDAALVAGIRQLAELVDQALDGLDLERLVDDTIDDPELAARKRRLIKRVKINLDYRVRGIHPEGYVAAGSRTPAGLSTKKRGPKSGGTSRSDRSTKVKAPS